MTEGPPKGETVLDTVSCTLSQDDDAASYLRSAAIQADREPGADPVAVTLAAVVVEVAVVAL